MSCPSKAPMLCYSKELIHSELGKALRKETISNMLVELTIYKDDGTEEIHFISSKGSYVTVFNELTHTLNYDMPRVHTIWNQWWRDGHLDDLKRETLRLLHKD